MRIRSAIAAVMLACPSALLALDGSDVGSYRIMSFNGEPTSKVFRLLGSADNWRIEDKQPDGRWVDVTCEGGCRLLASTEADHKRFFPADNLSKVTMSCVHNEAFAFCRYGRKTVAGERGYVFVALTERHPIPLKAVRE